MKVGSINLGSVLPRDAISVSRMKIFSVRWNQATLSRPDPEAAPDPAYFAKFRHAGRAFSCQARTSSCRSGVVELS